MSPVRIATDQSDNLYVTDGNNKTVNIYNWRGQFLNSYNLDINVIAIAVDEQGGIYVSDDDTGNIYQLNTIDNSLTIFYSGLAKPSDMCFDTQGLLYVVDREYRKVVVLNQAGQEVNEFGNGTFTYPLGIAYDLKNNRLLVTDCDVQGSFFGNDPPDVSVWYCGTDGSINGKFGRAGYDDGELTRVQGIAVSQNGNAYVIDPYQSEVSVFDEEGVFLEKFGGYGDNAGFLNVPLDIVFSTSNRAYITSHNNSNVEVFYANEILPTAEFITQKGVICSGSTENIEIDFTGTAPWTFTYTVDGANPVQLSGITEDPVTNTFVLEVTTPGIYEITELIDANFFGTEFTGSASIVGHELPTAEMTSLDAEICTGESTLMDISFTGVGPWTYTYAIDGVEKQSETTDLAHHQILVNQFGEYTITQLSDAGACAGTSLGTAFNVSDNGLPAATIKTEDVVLCDGASFTIEVAFTGVGPWNFEYTDGAQTNQVVTSDNPYLLSVNTSGVYEIISISDAVQAGTCTAGVVNVMAEDIVSSNIVTETINICEGEEATIDVELTGTAPWNLTYTIDGGNPVTITDIINNPYQLRVAQGGIVEVTALNSAFCIGQTITGSKAIVVKSIPDATFSLGNEKVNICSGETAELEVLLAGEGPWNFTYHIDEKNSTTTGRIGTSPYSLSVTKDGTYEIISVSDVNCSNDGNFASYPELVYFSPSATIISSNETICEGTSSNIQLELIGRAPWEITYTRDGANDVSISTSDPNYAIEVTEPGLYEIKSISDFWGSGICYNGAAQIDVIDKPVAAFGFNASGLEVSFINTSLSATTYEWDFGDGKTSVEANPTHVYSNTGTFTVRLTATSISCGSVSYSEQIEVVSTSIDDQILNNGFAIYPNPSDGEFNIWVSEGDQSAYTLEVINMFGELIISKQLEGSDAYKLNMKAYSAGVYNIRLLNGDKSYTSKVVITKK